jgi:serine kinase of HPr protein (carbohydrate metabolism regulator)
VTAGDTQTIHASAVLIGAHAVLIRGPAGAGKSRLALDLIEAAQAGRLPFARLVGDDRVYLEARAGRLIVRPAAGLTGLLEVRGAGIRQLAFEPVAAVGLVVDLAAADGERLPAAPARHTTIAGIRLPRLAVAAGEAALPLILALRQTAEWTDDRPGKTATEAGRLGKSNHAGLA